MAYVKGSTVKGGTAAARRSAARSAAYYMDRDGADRDSRVWQTHDGPRRDHDQVQEEIALAAQSSGYVSHVLLSTKEPALTPADYHDVVKRRFERYYFVEHGNTEHPHAHVIGFRRNHLSAQLLAQMRGDVEAVEQQRERERRRDAGLELD